MSTKKLGCGCERDKHTCSVPQESGEPWCCKTPHKSKGFEDCLGKHTGGQRKYKNLCQKCSKKKTSISAAKSKAKNKQTKAKKNLEASLVGGESGKHEGGRGQADIPGKVFNLTTFMWCIPL
jgi:hypothetical protein